MNTDRKEQLATVDAQAFMLAEYEMLRSLRSEVMSLGHTNVNFFLAVVTGAAVVVGLLSQSAIARGVPVVTGVIMVSLFLLGIVILLRTVERDVGITMYARGMNRIRRYFVEINPEIREYLSLPVTDDRPSFRGVGFLSRGSPIMNLSGTITIINSGIASIGATLLANSYHAFPLREIEAIAVVTFFLVGTVQLAYIAHRVNTMEKRIPVLFPSTYVSPADADSPKTDNDTEPAPESCI